MDMFVVQGGQPLAGRVGVSGAKNSALPIMAASLLADGPSVIWGVPDLADVRTLSQLLQTLGMNVLRGAAGEILLDVYDPKACVADYELVRRMRASICVLGPLLARRRFAVVSLPGGCAIGDRPVDLHLKGLRALGAEIRIERGYIIAKARKLRGASIYLGGPFGSTVTGTCNVMAAATLAAGVTTIEAAACEPEVVDFGTYLNGMGAKISGLGTPFVRIEGVDELIGTQHEIIPDRIEAATLILAAAITRGDVTLENVRLDHLTAVLEKLREIGVRIESTDDGVRIHTPIELRSADCFMLPHPGLPTDVQAQLMALLTTVPGISLVTDKVFPDRFMHVAEMARMGARIRREGPSAIVSGVPSLSGACVMASDLRASAALVLAALAAQGESVVRRIYHLDRGYDHLELKLNRLGGRITRVEDTPTNMPATLKASALERPADIDDADAEIRGPKWLTVTAPTKTKLATD
ncbi:MAG: UDP-N-acetylglucosamine 1-carboxyvinyltransferase [Planctomycetales bacterium]|nr:UDP-N-acetylglucosamine 1-carboxyvinyltransferase [Planctomycetales bacterium]